MKWSFSGLKQYVNCPHQFHQVKILKKYEVRVSEQMQFGTDVHKALEDYARDGTPLPAFYEKFKSPVDVLLEIPGTRYLEYKMALKQEYRPCRFDDPEYWVRGIVDFMVVDDKTAFIVDYKSGSDKYPDTKQLKLMALMTFAHFPDVDTVKGALLFLTRSRFMQESYERKDIDRLWSAFSHDLARMKASEEHNWWPTNPSGLCGWCPVTDCENHRSR